MKLQVDASYAATDGSMPESVSVEIDTEDVATLAVAEMAGLLLDRMLKAPARLRDREPDWRAAS